MKPEFGVGKSMNLKNWGGLVLTVVAVLGCASRPDLTDNSTLPVYDNNNVGYMFTKGGSSGNRVWTTSDTILALRFRDRVINAKDIDSVFSRTTDKKFVPLNIVVQLKSGEKLAADVADWGNWGYSDIVVEWMACNRQKACEYLRRATPSNFIFERFGNFLTTFNEDRFGDLIRPGQTVDQHLSYRLSDALPDLNSRSHMKFGDAAKISDLSEGMAAARAKAERVTKCVEATVASESRKRKDAEEQIIRTTPPAELERKLAIWRSSLPPSTPSWECDGR